MSVTTLSPAAHTQRALLARPHVVAPSLKVADAAAASVFGAARLRGPIARDVIAQVTQLSIATIPTCMPNCCQSARAVNRQVTALLDAGILREYSGRRALDLSLRGCSLGDQRV